MCRVFCLQIVATKKYSLFLIQGTKLHDNEENYPKFIPPDNNSNSN